jgi:hypothetical protein
MVRSSRLRDKAMMTYMAAWPDLAAEPPPDSGRTSFDVKPECFHKTQLLYILLTWLPKVVKKRCTPDSLNRLSDYARPAGKE